MSDSNGTVRIYRLAIVNGDIVPAEDFEPLLKEIEAKDKRIAELEGELKSRKTFPEYDEAISAISKENERLEADNERLRDDAAYLSDVVKKDWEEGGRTVDTYHAALAMDKTLAAVEGASDELGN